MITHRPRLGVAIEPRHDGVVTRSSETLCGLTLSLEDGRLEPEALAAALERLAEQIRRHPAEVAERLRHAGW